MQIEYIAREPTNQSLVFKKKGLNFLKTRNPETPTAIKEKKNVKVP